MRCEVKVRLGRRRRRRDRALALGLLMVLSGVLVTVAGASDAGARARGHAARLIGAGLAGSPISGLSIGTAPVGVAGTVEESGPSTIAAGAKATETVSCPSGDVATGGGGTASDNPGLEMFEDFPSPATGVDGSIPTGWEGSWENTTGSSVTVYTYAICASKAAAETLESLSVAVVGPGAGLVSGGGINCPSACSSSEPLGSQVTLTATPASGSTFSGWSGSGCGGTGTCTLIMNAPQSVTATFTSGSIGSRGPGSTQTSPKAVLARITFTGASAALKIKCGGTEGVCAGMYTLATRERIADGAIVGVDARNGAKSRPVTVASGRYSVVAGQTRLWRVTLNAMGKHLLAQFYKVPAVLTITGAIALMREVTFFYGRINATIFYEWQFTSTSSSAQSITIPDPPPHARVVLLCHGGGCPFAKRVFTAKRAIHDLGSTLAHAHLSPGATVSVEITAPNDVGKVLAFSIRSGALPRVSELCLPPGAAKPRACM